MRYKRSKSGNIGVCGVTGDRTLKVFLYAPDDDSVILKLPGNQVEKIQLWGSSGSAAMDAEQRRDSLVDNHGTWSADDDFSGDAGAYPNDAGFVKKPNASATKPSSRGRSPLYVNNPAPGDPFADSLDAGPPDIGPFDAWDSGTVDPFDQLDTSPYDFPDDTAMSKDCMVAAHNVEAATQALTQAQSAAAAACKGTKSARRSTMAAKKKKIKPRTNSCIFAEAKLAGALASLTSAQQAALKLNCPKKTA